MATDTAELIRAVGWKSAHVFGHSLGGGIAQRVATEHPEVIRTLILMGTGPGDGVTGMINPKFAPFRMPPADRSPEALTGWLTGFHRFCIDPDPVDESSLTSFVRRQVERAPNADMQCVPAGVASNQLGLASTPSHPDLLSQLQIATLVIGGTADRVVAFDGSERLAELIPGSALLRIEGMGHLPSIRADGGPSPTPSGNTHDRADERCCRHAIGMNAHQSFSPCTAASGLPEPIGVLELRPRRRPALR